jgi:hypothetical protein
VNDGGRNPYAIAGHERAPLSPLDPLSRPDDEDFYVDVGNSEEAFRQFQSAMDDVAALRSRGQLVVVAGEHGCGKTSLANRCAAWLGRRLRAAGVDPVVIDARGSVYGYESVVLSIEKRMHHVVDDLVHSLRAGTDIPVEPGFVDQDVTRAYRSIVDVIPDERRLVVLLPPSELPAEIEQYAALARYPGLVFFAEAEYGKSVRRVPSAGELVVLEVGPLSKADGWRFIATRQDRADSVPSVSFETAQAILSSDAISIATLQRLMYGLYQEVLNNRGQFGDEITFGDVGAYAVRSIMDGTS